MATQHTCPYAAALSDDETSQNSPPHGSISPDQLSMARSKCPAFANACPFKDAADNPDKLRDIMKTVPASHFPQHRGDNIMAKQGNKTGFQLAMEHIHTVSSWLGSTKKAVAEGEQYIIQGGCPFKSFHKNHSSSSEKRLIVAMEEYSLAAIMGQLGASFDKELDDVEREEEELSDEPILSKELDPTENSALSVQQIDRAEKSLTSQASTLSQALKSGTAESHTAAENVHFVKNFIKGIIDRELYMELVTGLYHTYQTMEKLLDVHGPVHFPSLHFPKELSRSEALREDMEFWYGIDWESKPECRTPSPAVKDYIERMEEIGRIDPMLLLSHAYTRYLGDLSGGKVLSRIARRALKLDGDNGLQFYKFDSISSYKVFKDQYRDALDNLALAPDKVGRLVAEANVGKLYCFVFICFMLQSISDIDPLFSVISICTKHASL